MGIGHILVANNSEYKIRIEYSGYFEINEIRVGSRDVKFEDLYYFNSTDVHGFAPGTRESFKFCSTSKRELEEGGTKHEGENETNIIRVKIQPMRRISALARRSTDTMSRGGGSAMSRGGGGTADSGLIGGATVSGGSYIHEKVGVQTNDTFEPIGSPVEITLQLICNESEEDKYNQNKNEKRIAEIDRNIKERTEKINKLKEDKKNLINRTTSFEEQSDGLLAF